MKLFGSGRLGNTIHNALGIIGVTPERVERWLGEPCNCNERIEQLNRLGAWANRVISGKVEDAKKYLDEIIGA